MQRERAKSRQAAVQALAASLGQATHSREALKSLAVMVTETREKLFAVMDAQTAEEAQAVMAGTAGEEGNSNNPNLDTFGDVPMARLDDVDSARGLAHRNASLGRMI